MDDTTTIYVLCIVMDVNVVIVEESSENNPQTFILYIKDNK